jgi:hypothetical protein
MDICLFYYPSVYPINVDGHEPHLCRKVIQFIAALSVQIALEVQNALNLFTN